MNTDWDYRGFVICKSNGYPGRYFTEWNDEGRYRVVPAGLSDSMGLVVEDYFDSLEDVKGAINRHLDGEPESQTLKATVKGPFHPIRLGRLYLDRDDRPFLLHDGQLIGIAHDQVVTACGADRAGFRLPDKGSILTIEVG